MTTEVDLNALLADLGDRIRELYLTRRNVHMSLLFASGQSDKQPTKKLPPQYDGGEDSRGFVYKSVWPSLAEFAYKHKLDPQTWVDAMFSIVHRFDRVPWPSDLKSPEVLEAVAHYPETRAADIRYSIQTERLLVSQEIWIRAQTSKQPAEVLQQMVLVDPRLEVTALTRYVESLSYGHKSLAKTFESLAFAQYRVAPNAYDEAFGAKHLDGFRKLLEATQ